jgi:Asp-tRNA(Asn)/Glu-tRNA(Gln) amidotransferase A subunit family amidase
MDEHVGQDGRSGSSAPPPGVTIDMVRAAEHLQSLDLTAAARTLLAETLPQQIGQIRAIRDLPRPLDLQPALIFDPRIPGRPYPMQATSIRTSERDIGAPPSEDVDLAFASVGAISHWIRTGGLTSVRITEIYLERIGRIAPALNCFITVTADLARQQAATADADLAAGRWRGPLHGVPYALKDVFDTSGVATTWGSSIYRDRTPSEDATVVKMLREAGAVLLGKAATGELANGYEWFGGACRNPWNVEEPAGGSSTGSASATAAGLCAFAIGTDSAGSIIGPSDRCGVTGLRATFGRVPVNGAMPLTPSLDRIGPICRRVEDTALVLAAINGPDSRSPASSDMGFEYDAQIDLSTLTIGYSPNWFKNVGFGPGASRPAAQGHHNALAALRDLGPKVVEIELPPLPYSALLPLLFTEAAAVFEELQLNHLDDKLLNQHDFGWPNSWRKARMISAVDYVQLDRFRRQVMLAMDDIFSRVDMLFAPTYGSFDLVLITNFTGHPGLTFRSGLEESPTRSIYFVSEDPDGPLHRVTNNVILHGRLYEEGKMIALAQALEDRLGAWDARPPVG